MMRLQTLLALGFALVFGGAAAVGVNVFLRNQTGAAPVETVPVLVSSSDVPRGAMITSDLVSIKTFPKEMAPAGALAKVEDAIDRAVAVPLVSGEPVIDSKLSKKGAGRGLAALVPKGMRAVTVMTPNVSSGLAGFVLPGSKVDILLTVSENGGLTDTTGGGSTTTLLQNVEILAVDQRMDAPSDNKVDMRDLRSVTLLVTPQQANLLDLGQNKGILHLSLRNHQDDDSRDIAPATLADIRFKRDKPWDEKAKGILEAFGQALAKRQPPAPEPPPAPEAVAIKTTPPPPVQQKIRTIRGVYEGQVVVDVNPSSGQ